MTTIFGKSKSGGKGNLNHVLVCVCVSVYVCVIECNLCLCMMWWVFGCKRNDRLTATVGKSNSGGKGNLNHFFVLVCVCECAHCLNI